MTSRTTNLGPLTPFARRWEVPSYSVEAKNCSKLQFAPHLERWAENMKTRHYFSSAPFAISIVHTAIGVFKGAAVLIGLATAIKLIASVVTGKKINVQQKKQRPCIHLPDA